MSRRVLIINPLQGALAHYVDVTCDALRTIGASVDVVGIAEPSGSWWGRVRWLRQYLMALLRARSTPAEAVLITWPVLGYLDVVLISLLLGRRGWLVMHDPRPLVRARGYGSVERRWAGRSAGRTRVIVHSSAAERDVRADCPPLVLYRMLLPIGPSGERHERDDVVRVLGQYKRDRDVRVMSALANGANGLSFEAVGRGWPDVPGWCVRSEFVSEGELDRLVSTSAVVLIPYKNFYQSDIAVRCLEASTPIIGPANTSLGELVGDDSPLLAHEGDYDRAITFAVGMHQDEVAALAELAHHRFLGQLAEWITACATEALRRHLPAARVGVAERGECGGLMPTRNGLGRAPSQAE